MMEDKYKYPYRFKTKEEFKNEFGPNWYTNIQSGRWVIDMDFLFGIVYPFTQKEIDVFTDFAGVYPDYQHWSISFDMLTKNMVIPTYKPKEKIERIV